MPFFSILIPVYNVEKYLNECLDSVMTQGFTDYEVILIDDGSTDNSGTICDEYAAKDSRFIVRHKENEGLLCARRDAIKMAKGQYIMFLDSDDYWADNILETIYSVIQDNLCDIVIFTMFSIRGSNITADPCLFSELKTFEGTAKKNLYELMLTKDSLNSLCSKAVKREIVDIDNDYGEYKGLSLGEDLLQSAIYLVNADRIVYLPQPFYYYRRSIGMTSKTKPSYLNNLTQSRAYVTNLFTKTNSNLEDAINKQAYNYLNNINKIIIRCIQNGYDLSVSSEFTDALNSDFYKACYNRAYKQLSFLQHTIIKYADKRRFKALAFIAWLLHTKTKIGSLVKRR